MTATKEHRLEVGEDPAFQKRSWQFQHAGFIGLLVFLACGALGVFGGGGWLASATARQGSLTVDYDRFVRFGAPTEMRIRLGQTSGADAGIRLDRSFVDAVTMKQILPPPEAIAVSGEDFLYVYPTPSAPDRRALAVTFSYTPRKIGRLFCRVRTADDGVELRQTAFP